MIDWFEGSKDLEKIITLEMMKLKGINKVRGGAWTQTELNNPPNYSKVKNTKIKYGKNL
jgi:hypothetical protein